MPKGAWRHTFGLGDGNVAVVGGVDAEAVWATYWFFDRVRDIPAEITPEPKQSI